MKLKKHKVYQIDWIDTTSRTGWWSNEQIDKISKEVETLNTTSGYFIKYFGSFIIMASSLCFVDNFNPYGHIIFIPIKTIKKIRLLK